MKIKLTRSTSGRCRLYLITIICLYSSVSYSQFEVGLGLFNDSHLFTPEDIELPNEVILTTVHKFFPSPKWYSVFELFDDSRIPIFMSYQFPQEKTFQYSVDVIYFKKFQNMFVGEVDSLFGFLPKGSHIATGTLQFFGNIGVNFTTPI